MLRSALPSRTEFHAVARRYGDGVSLSVGAPDRSETYLRSLLADPFESVEDVADRLSTAEAYLHDHDDRRAVFLTVYVAMTERVRTQVERDDFVDPPWVHEYLVAFADYYRQAFVAFEAGSTVPPAWNVAFGTALGGETLVIQDALLGINAHIVHDLALALDTVGIDPHRSDKRRDHDAINEVLTALADVVQQTLATVYEVAGLSEADAVLGRVDEAATMVGLRTARRFAWDNAVLLADAPFLTRYVRWRLRAVSTGTAYAILSASLSPTVRRQLRDAERGESTLSAVAAAVHGQ